MWLQRAARHASKPPVFIMTNHDGFKTLLPNYMSKYINELDTHWVGAGLKLTINHTFLFQYTQKIETTCYVDYTTSCKTSYCIITTILLFYIYF